VYCAFRFIYILCAASADWKERREERFIESQKLKTFLAQLFESLEKFMAATLVENVDQKKLGSNKIGANFNYLFLLITVIAG